MSRIRRPPPSKPNNGYLVSFGDTMTALLAFFIVLNALAQDQTGINLYRGTGSFVAALNDVGTDGYFDSDSSKNVFQRDAESPIYMVDDGQDSPDPGRGNGPDAVDNQLRVIDRDQEQLQRLLNELEQALPTQQTAEHTQQVSFDLFKALGPPPNILSFDVKQVIAQSLPMVLRGNHRLEIAVWAPMPSPSTIRRAARQAKQVRQQIIDDFVLDVHSADQIRCGARLWPLSNEKRPVLTVTVIATD